MQTGFRIHWATMLFVLAFILLAPGAASAPGAQEPLGVRLLQPDYLSAIEPSPIAIEVNANTAWGAPYKLTITSEDEMVEQTLTGTLALDHGRNHRTIEIDPTVLSPFALGENLTLSIQIGNETVSTESTLVAESATTATSTWSIALNSKPAMLYTTKDATLTYSVMNPKPVAKNGVIKIKFLYQKKPNGAWKNATVLQTTAALSPGLNTINITVPSSLTNQVKNLNVIQEKSILIVGGIVRNTEQAVVDYDLAATASATPTSGVEPLDVSFTADATGGKSPYSFNWDFGDGNTSPDQNPLHTYTAAGTYTASVQIVDYIGGVIHKTLTITVNSTSGVTCTSSKESGTAPLTVNFTCTPNGGVAPYTYDWNYGDGSQHGTTQNPGHIYTVTGTYTYSVTVTDAINQTANCGGTINVYPVLTVTATATPPSGTVPLTVSFTSTPSGGNPASYAYSWTFGDGGTATTQNPNYTYNSAGSYTVNMTVTDGLQTATLNPPITITVTAANHNPTIDTFTATPTTIYSGDYSNISGTTSDIDGDTVSWTLSFDPASTGTASFTGPTSGSGTISSQIQGANGGTVIVRVNANDGHGGTATATLSITVQ